MKKYLLSSLVIFMLATACTKQEQLTPAAIQNGAGRVNSRSGITKPIIKTVALPISDAFIGIRWTTDDDLDLIIIDSATGLRLGTFAYNNEVEYSGDQQTGYGISGFDGNELFYASTHFRPALIKVKYYNGTSGYVNFSFYTGQQHITNLTGNYKVQSSSISYNYAESAISPIGTLRTVGCISGGKLYIYK
jgi:hypothetical protein